jgi:hypothetical protein
MRHWSPLAFLSLAAIAASAAAFIATAYLGIFVSGAFAWLLGALVMVPAVASMLAYQSAGGPMSNGEVEIKGPITKDVLVAAVVLVLIVVPAYVPTQLTSADPSTSQGESWREADGRYYAQVKGQPEREVSKAEFEAATSKVVKILTLSLMLVSLVSLHLSHQVAALRRKREHDA